MEGGDGWDGEECLGENGDNCTSTKRKKNENCWFRCSGFLLVNICMIEIFSVYFQSFYFNIKYAF